MTNRPGRDLGASNVSRIGAGEWSFCQGCQSIGRCALGLEADGLDEDGVGRFDVICPPQREGAPGVAHGGWIADVFDESMGLATVFSGYFTVTQSLTVNFLRPVPIRSPLLMIVQPVSNDPGRVRMVGELNLASTGSTLATAEAWYVRRDAEKHLTRFKSWITEQEATSTHDE